jgi:hypothetical protein
MSPHLGRAAFRVAFYIAAVALILLFFLRPGSAEFGITVITLVVGLIFLGLVAVLVRYFSR